MRPDDENFAMQLRKLLSQDYLALTTVLVALVLFFGLQSEYFWSLLTFATLANQIPALT